MLPVFFVAFRMFKFLTRSIWILSLVSLFADLASEMLYPIMPLFLNEIGMTAAGIGLLEGMASLVAGFGKAWFGSLSDRLGRRNIFVRVGYGKNPYRIASRSLRIWSRTRAAASNSRSRACWCICCSSALSLAACWAGLSRW